MEETEDNYLFKPGMFFDFSKVEADDFLALVKKGQTKAMLGEELGKSVFYNMAASPR